MITLTIDGKKIETQKGKRILEAALENGIYIPNLCALADIELPFGACRLCFVEVEGMKEPITACTEPVREGMIVHTVTDKLTKLRRTVLDFILSKHPHECLICYKRDICDPLTPCLRTVSVQERCVTCPKDKRCDLQKVVKYVGLESLKAPYEPRQLPIWDDPLIARDYNLCILCGRCVRVCQEIRGIGAIAFTQRGGRAVVGTLFNDSLKNAGCKFCGACVEVCPTGALMDRDLRWKTEVDRRAALVPCTHTCPAGIDVPRYLRLTAEGKFAEALAVIREKVPFPGVLGHVCFHYCEGVCRRGKLNAPIAIRAIKRFLAENGGEQWKAKSKKAPKSGKKVAIVGSGPCGLTAAYYLAKKGHAVTVFEATSLPGGMLRWAIPEFRLPRNVLDAEIAEITRTGVEIKTGTRIDSPDQLLRQGFHAVLLALGTQSDAALADTKAPGDRIIGALKFLAEANAGKLTNIGGRVAIVGESNATVDAARMARRLGAAEVTVFVNTPITGMRIPTEEIEQALAEGIIIHQVSSLPRLSPGEQQVQVTGTVITPEGAPQELTMDCDRVILCVAQVPDVPDTMGVEKGIGGTIRVDDQMFITSRKDVFAAGDVITGPGSVIGAIAQGRKAAAAIDRHLGGDGIIEEHLAAEDEPSQCFGRDEGFADWKRVEMPCLKPEERIRSMAEVELGFRQEDAVAEARRCLKCDLRFKLDAMLPMAAGVEG